MISNNKSIFENIYQSFDGLNSVKQKKILCGLNSEERKILVKIFNNKIKEILPNIHKNQKEINNILKTIRNEKNLPFRITKIKDKRSILSLIGKAFKRAISYLLSLFGYMSATSAMKQVQKQPIPSFAANNASPLIKEDLLKEILEKAVSVEKKPVKLADLLKEKGFSPILSKISFNKTSNFSEIDLSEITFDRCRFYWTPFKKTSLTNTLFSRCKIEYASFNSAHLRESSFKECKIRGAFFLNTHLKNVAFEASNLLGCSFEDATLSGGTFTSTNLAGTHFLEANLSKKNPPKIEKSLLEDAALFDNEGKFQIDQSSLLTRKTTRPFVLFFCDSENRGFSTPQALSKIESEAGCIPLRLAIHSPKQQAHTVKKELKQILKRFGTTSENLPEVATISRGAFLVHTLENQIEENLKKNINKSFSSAEQILKKAKAISKYVDGIYLTGGEDIPPLIYGEKQAKETVSDGDLRRTLLELCLIKESIKKGIPIMGVCRGFQIANIYFGAKLNQHVSWQEGVQLMQLKKNEGLFGDKAFLSYPKKKSSPFKKKNILVGCSHHQAIFKENSSKTYLEEAIVYDKIIKASQPKDSGAAPAILTQFHPEFYKTETAHSFLEELFEPVMNLLLTENNSKVWKIFQDSCQTYRKKKRLPLFEEIKNFQRGKGSSSITTSN